MIIIKLMGGLGNQLQQYALYQKLISLGKECYLDLSWFEASAQQNMAAQRECELKLFEGADYNIASAEQIYSLIGDGSARSKIFKKLASALSDSPEIRNGKRKRIGGIIGNGYFAENRMYHPEIFDMDDVYLEGYWAAEKYYADILPLLSDKLKFDEADISAENREAAKKILTASASADSGANSCAVHIRRGDYLDPINLSMFGNISTRAYYDAAFELVRNKYPQTKFFLFSDDTEYVTEHYGSDESCEIIDINHGADSRFDIYLMSLCDMHICANSTFSFWGTRLSKLHKPGEEIKEDKAILNIRPTIQKNTQVFDKELMHDLWKGWTFVDPAGKVIDD